MSVKQKLVFVYYHTKENATFPLTYDLKLHCHLRGEIRQIYRADINPGVTYFSFLQGQGCISLLMHSIKVHCGSFLCGIGQAVCLAVVSQNQSSFASELVAPFDSKTRPWQKWGRVDPEATVQQHWFPKSGLDGNCFTGHAQDHWGNRRESQILTDQLI